MSLLSGMNDMLRNDAAMEAASDEILFQEELAMEADELIDVMVDKATPFSDDIDEMEKEDEEEDEINEELDKEDNSIAKATEAAALTGQSFLDSLLLDNNDPISTMDGSIGLQDGTANHDKNYAGEYDDNTDPIKTQDGSVGQKDSEATNANNFSAEANDNTDPIKTQDGSVGQKDSSATPTIAATTKESMSFFGELLDEEVAMEGLISKLKDIKESKTAAVLQQIGLAPLDQEKLTQLLNGKKYSQAISMVNAYGKKLEAAKSKAESGEDYDKKVVSKINSLIKATSSYIIAIETQKKVDVYLKAGMSQKDAEKRAGKDVRSQMGKVKDAATESYLSDCIDFALEHMKFAGEDLDDDDPITTQDGSIGQKTSAANHKDNFTDGDKDVNDPVKTKDGSEGQQDSAANYDNNYSDGEDDETDPIKTDDGSVGQKDSSANPKTATESTVDDELSFLNDIMYSDMDDLDDDLI